MSQARWSAIVPVKRMHVAKSRLLGVDPELRRRLALAFAADTVGALRVCPRVVEVVVVTDDPQAREMAAGQGVRVVPDEPDAGLNPALVHAARQVRAYRPAGGLAMVSADLPALRPTEVGVVLAEADGHERSFVADVAGLGTTVLCSRPGVDPSPVFGPRSRAAHRRSGAVEIVRPDIVSVRRDVDTDVDLWDALRMGVGPATSTVWTLVG